MEMKLEMVPVEKLADPYSLVSMMDSTQTIMNGLTQSELDRYGKAINKIEKNQVLNIKDLRVFDKIDAITYDKHGMCLKDSQVTKARIKACKKHRIEFIDRDGLIDHMNFMLPEQDEASSKVSFYQSLGEFMVSRMGMDAMYELHDLIGRVEGGSELTLADLELLSKLEEIASNALNWTIVNEDIRSAIHKASKKLGIYFQNLQQVTTH